MNESLKMVPTGNTDWSTITTKAIHHHYVGNIASHRKLMLPVMFCKYNVEMHTSHSLLGNLFLSLYKSRKFDVQRTLRGSPRCLLGVLCTSNVHPVSSGSTALSTSHRKQSCEQCQIVICLLSYRL